MDRAVLRYLVFWLCCDITVLEPLCAAIPANTASPWAAPRVRIDRRSPLKRPLVSFDVTLKIRFDDLYALYVTPNMTVPRIAPAITVVASPAQLPRSQRAGLRSR